MARKVRDKALDSKAERRKLAVSMRPYYRSIGQGVHLGFRKGQRQGTWIARLYAGGGNYHLKRIGFADDDLNDADGQNVLTFHQAAEKARELAKAGAVTGPYSVAAAMADYLAFIEDKPSAYHARKRAETLILPALGKTEVAALTADRMRKWLRSLASEPPRWRSKTDEPNYRTFDATDPDAVRRRRATANRTLTVLKAALNHAFREGKVASDAEWRRVSPFESVETARVRYLTIAEAKRLLKAAAKDFRPLVEAALQTGARYGELARLEVADFDAAAGTLTIRQSKSGKARHIILTDEGRRFFARLTKGRASNETMLLTAAGSPWAKSMQIRPMAESCQRAKITPAIGFHILRHTWASLSIMNGVPLQVAARNLGHSDTRMVEKHYGHLSKDFIADAIRAGAPRFGARA